MWMSGRGFTRGCDQDHRFAKTRLFSADSSSRVFAPKNKAGHRSASIHRILKTFPWKSVNRWLIRRILAPFSLLLWADASGVTVGAIDLREISDVHRMLEHRWTRRRNGGWSL